MSRECPLLWVRSYPGPQHVYRGTRRLRISRYRQAVDHWQWRCAAISGSLKGRKICFYNFHYLLREGNWVHEKIAPVINREAVNIVAQDPVRKWILFPRLGRKCDLMQNTISINAPKLPRHITARQLRENNPEFVIERV